MSNALRAELRKLGTTRSLWLLPVLGVAVSVVAGTVLIAALPASEQATRLSEHGPLRFGPSNVGLLLVIFGIRLFGDETHHGTLASTYVDVPDRKRVLLAKASVAASVAAGVTAAIYTVVVPVTVLAVDQRGLDMTMDLAATGALLARVLAAMVLLVVLGVAIAAAVRNRAVALVGTIVWLALAEPIVGSVLKVAEYLPSAAVNAFVSGGAGTEVAAPAAALMLVATVAAATGCAFTALRADVA